MNKKRSNLKDVANLAGTSVATASRALTGKGYVSDSTREEVFKAARTLSYQPNLLARSLRERQSHSIGFIIPNLLNAYYTEMADAIITPLAAKGFTLLLSSTQDDEANEREMLYSIIGQGVDGLIWVPTGPSQETIEFILGLNFPSIAIVRRIEGDVLDTVIFEDFDGSVAATEHLIDLGHKRIGYIGGEVRYSSNCERYKGFYEAMKKADLPLDENLVKIGSVLETWGITATSELLRLPSPPTAIFVGSNAIMPGVVKTLRNQQIDIPRDISLICYDDVDWFSFSSPPITAVKVPHTRLAEVALNLLQRRLDEVDYNNLSPSFVKIPFELVLRRSTAPPREEK